MPSHEYLLAKCIGYGNSSVSVLCTKALSFNLNKCKTLSGKSAESYHLLDCCCQASTKPEVVPNLSDKYELIICHYVSFKSKGLSGQFPA